MNNNKIIITLKSVSILLIVLFLLFFYSIYNDYSKIELGEGKREIEVIARSEEIRPITVPKNNEEIVMVEVNPDIIPVQNNSNEEVTYISEKFYYNQLNEYSKLIYESLENQKEKLKTGTSIIKIPDGVKEILETEKNNIEAVFSIAINAFEYDNPDVFYLDSSKLVLYYEKDNGGDYKIYLKHNDQYENYLIDSFRDKQEVEMAESNINNIVEQIKNEMQGMDTEKKVRYIHNWLVGNVRYDETLNKTNRSNIYGAFIEKEITCAGYAKTFKYIIDELNINCIIVQGTATSDTGTENHAWNYVQLDNKWYGVDCTWDDPIIIGGNGNEESQIYYTYYLKGQNVFNNSHKPFESFYSTNVEINYPELEQNDFILVR